MTYLFFIILTGSIGVLGAFLVGAKSKWPLGRIILPVLAVLLYAAAYTQYLASFDANLAVKSVWMRAAITLHLLIAWNLLELTMSFLGKDGIGQRLTLYRKPLHIRYIWRPLVPAAIGAVIWAPWFTFQQAETDIIVRITHIGELLFTVLFGFYLLILYITEKIFRNTTPVQKRVFTLYLASTALIALGSMILLVRILFYREVNFETVQIHAALCAIFFPGMLIGLVKYRLWQEQIVIDRGMIHTSFTFLFFGVFLILLGIIASVVRFLGIIFTQFEEFVILFSFIFVSLITIFSPQMRRTITGLTRKYLYKAKYDYRDQLLRLHLTHQTTGNVRQTVWAFIDNLRFTILVKNANIFLLNQNENLFIQFEEPNHPIREKLFFRQQSPLVKLFNDNTTELIDVDNPLIDEAKQAITAETTILEKAAISHLFPIRHRNILLGILGIEAGSRIFDTEDLMLISMFCESIGTAIYRDLIQHENIERKQFESFTHMASFIVHDIKNQVATLSLVTNNARANIDNPEFHPVLLRSLENCSSNLSTLIAKLQSPPKKETLAVIECDCNEVVSRVVGQAESSLPANISLTEKTGTISPVKADPDALYYVLKNLIINALEAIGNRQGNIRCTTGKLTALVQEDTFDFNLIHTDQGKFSVYVVVEDNGPGMTAEFIEQRLFKPFNTTKDKGIGIGLYQCKTLIETMGGRLLCSSEPGKGTRFCILL